MNQPPQPPYFWLPEPRPPVSSPAEPQPHGFGGSTGGVQYGSQVQAIWKVGETDARQVCDALKCDALWRFSAFGRVIIQITYGTASTRKIVALQAPCVLTIPGQFTAIATPVDGAGAECRVTLTQATAGARSIARRFVTAPAGDVDLDPDAVDFFALAASTLTVSGQAVAVPALAIVPLVSGAVLHTGSGFQEYET